MLRILISLLFIASTAHATGTYLDFDEFTPTAGSVPADSPNWEYSSAVTNNYGYSESYGSGWKRKVKQGAEGWDWFWQYTTTGQCGFYTDTYGYMDITTGHTGNALRTVITGGLKPGTPCLQYGTQLYNKESYTSGKVYTGPTVVGKSYIYHKKVNTIGVEQDRTPFSSASGANRLTMLVRLPDTWDN
jgi:hypothetical protein